MDSVDDIFLKNVKIDRWALVGMKEGRCGTPLKFVFIDGREGTKKRT
jgi:hypothetical protein